MEAETRCFASGFRCTGEATAAVPTLECQGESKRAKKSPGERPKANRANGCAGTDLLEPAR